MAFMVDSVDILGCRVDKVSMEEAVRLVGEWVLAKGCHQVITLNAEIIYRALKEPELKKVIDHADLVTPDGAGVVWASRRAGDRVPERVTGIDLVCRLAEEGNKRGWSLFLLGARPGVAEEAARRLAQNHPGLKIAGCYHGYFTEQEELPVIDMINEANPDILLVALGAPRQDLWIAKRRGQLNCRVAIGVGGSFDVLSGNLERAPQWMIEHNLEWLYRLLKEPNRIKRQMALPAFVFRVIWQGKRKRT